MREIPWNRVLRNAALAVAVLALAGFGLVSMAERNWQWQKTFRVEAAFPSIGGVEDGARVLVQGISAGVVEAVRPPSKPGGPVVLVLRLDDRLRHLVRADALARIATQGVVGSKVVEIVPGAPEAPALAEGATLRAEPPLELADLMKRASVSFDRLDQSFERIDAVAVAAEQGLGQINAIASTINRGEGTLGRLVQEDEAYNRLISLSARGEKALEGMDENLTALKRTWPISSYFKDRGFLDADRLLYQPDARRESQVLPADDLFEPGSAVLTTAGRRRLDVVARWFKSAERPDDTSIVVAAFTDQAPEKDEELAQILTQGQAEAIRTYLVSQHQIDQLPWYKFTRRTVAAVGYGTREPRAARAEAEASGPPRQGRRVEVILFTPQKA